MHPSLQVPEICPQEVPFVLLKYVRKMAELVHLCVKRDITEVIVIYLVPHPVQQMNAANISHRLGYIDYLSS
jgi:hypothetical protein